MGTAAKLSLFFGKAVIVGLAFAAVAILTRQYVLEPPLDDSSTAAANPPTIRSFSEAVTIAAPAVVNVYVDRIQLRARQSLVPRDPQFRRFAGGTLLSTQLINRQVLGSGVILREDGIIVTNFHVVFEADNINVALWDGRVTQARVIGVDEETDLALLKVDYDNLPTLQAPDQPLLVGDVVLAIGNPLGLGKTVTMGIVSATGRSDLKVSLYETLIQTDAAINEGNSGGALINPDGDIVGINTAVGTLRNSNPNEEPQNAEGISFAIPIETVMSVANTLIEDGVIVRGWLGTVLSDSGNRAARRAAGQPGVTVVGVYQGEPAEAAGLQAGDYITRMDGQPVSDRVTAYRLIANTLPGTRMSIEYWRDGQQIVSEADIVLRTPATNQLPPSG
ncbi:MAG: trypsin-like peptidase domain-containing protein [Pseudomonadota bacterium]